MNIFHKWLHHLWYDQAHKHSRLMCLLFLFLKPISRLYAYTFSVVMCYKFWFSSHKRSLYSVISIGNLAVGGTGKTVVVSFFKKKILQEKKGAIALRGYAGRASSTKQSIVVANDQEVLLSVDKAGDEAIMLAQQNQCPIVIGKSRAKSCALLYSIFADSLDYVLLDDAYQHLSVQKDLEIVLLDARYAWKDMHLLPAGFLREKDLSRADMIILTHAQGVDVKKYHTSLPVQYQHKPLFSGRIVNTGLFLNNTGTDCAIAMKQQPVILFSGIGNNRAFVQSVKNYGCKIIKIVDLGDHYRYTKEDLQRLEDTAIEHGVTNFITTHKDWVKLEGLLALHGSFKLSLYIAAIEFEFLSPEQYHLCSQVVSKKLGWEGS